MMLARKSALEKVASFLITLAERTGRPIGSYTTCALPMTRSDIADFLGLTIETVSRTLTRLRKQDIIALETSQTVLIKDMDALISASQPPTAAGFIELRKRGPRPVLRFRSALRYRAVGCHHRRAILQQNPRHVSFKVIILPVAQR